VDQLPNIVGGDFNTVNAYWIGHTIPVFFAQDQGLAVRTLMASHGFSTPFGDGVTFPLFAQKLDWIYLKGLRSEARGIVDIHSSDHRAIWSRIIKK